MSNEDPQQSDAATRDDLSDSIADAIAEVLESVEIDSEPEERLVLADEIVEKFISPLMMQRAAGATSQVTVTMNPAGGVSGAHSIKARNALVNLKHAATAVPASLPALANFYERNGISGDIGTTALAVLFLFPLLKSIAEAVKVPLTQQAAAVLMVMWNTKNQDEDTVPLEGLLARVNETFEEYGWRPIQGGDLTAYLEALEKIHSIERVNEFESITASRIEWRLKEAVEIAH